jgi:hypothetical protein
MIHPPVPVRKGRGGLVPPAKTIGGDPLNNEASDIFKENGYYKQQALCFQQSLEIQIH